MSCYIVLQDKKEIHWFISVNVQPAEDMCQSKYGVVEMADRTKIIIVYKNNSLL